MMDYRAGYYKLFGEITRALCALLSAAAPGGGKIAGAGKAARSLNIFPHWCCAEGRGFCGAGTGAVCAYRSKNNLAVRHRWCNGLGARARIMRFYAFRQAFCWHCNCIYILSTGGAISL